MATFITIGYGDRAGYESTEQGVRDAAHMYDDQLRNAGVHMGVAGGPVQVRNHDLAGVQRTKGAFMTSSLPVAGFAIIEAATMAEAEEIVSRTPCAVAHGVVEIWPLERTT